jgi:hypothetical protein
MVMTARVMLGWVDPEDVVASARDEAETEEEAGA